MDIKDVITAIIIVAAVFGIAGYMIGNSLSESNNLVSCDTRAVANGCAVRVLDSASGQVKTIWKDGKP